MSQKKLNVERFVIRFWEREFGIKAGRSSGGQRFYDAKDLQRISLIKELLYDNGFTIAGAKKYLSQHKDLGKAKKMLVKAAQLDTSNAQNKQQDPEGIAATLPAQLQALKAQLLRLSTLLS